MLCVRELSYNAGATPVLKNVSFELKSGENLLILGENGSGKTTLFKLLLALLPPKSGEILLFDKPLKSYRRRDLAATFAYIPQYKANAFEFSVLEVVLLGCFYKSSIFGDYSKEQKERALQMLERLDIAHLKDRAYTQLSGGQRQLVFIARALMQDTPVIFMDEPTTGLDFANQIKFLHLLQKLNEEGKNYILTMHNLRQATFLGGKVLLLKRGEVLACGEASSVLSDENLVSIYGKEFLQFCELL